MMRNKRYDKRAFTLAEVLITLGIIGIVAAMTIPTLISEHRKKSAAARIAQTYSILQQCIYRSIADNGDVATWPVLRQNIGSKTKTSAPMEILRDHIYPYLTGAKLYEDKTTFASVGLKNGIKYPDGTTYAPPNGKASFLKLKNGVIIAPNMQRWGRTLEDGTKDYSYPVVIFVVCIDGANDNATVGVDVFVMSLIVASGQLKMSGDFKSISASTFLPTDTYTREELLSGCSETDYSLCGGLIRHDGWKISKDYPWYK